MGNNVIEPTKTFVAHYHHGILQIQRADYIEDGWYIESGEDGKFVLFDIPEGGGDESTIDQARPVFSAFAKKTAFIGQAGAGQAMKLAVNLIVHSLNAAVSEALALATANGIEASAAYDVLEESVVAAPFVKYKRAAFLDTSAPVAMRIDTVGKDLGLILGLGKESGVDLRAASGIAELYQQAASAGYEAQDMASLFRFIQNLDENVI